jgi:hypothetical protein
MSGLATFERQPPMQTLRQSRGLAVADIAARSILGRLWGGLPTDRIRADHGKTEHSQKDALWAFLTSCFVRQ